MERLAGRSIFSLGKHVYQWEDVILAAHLWDVIPALERRVVEGLAAQRRLGQNGKEVSDDDVEQRASDWRYERNLISADDTESWLAARELSVDEWFDYVRRAEARTRSETQLKTLVKRHRPAPGEVDQAMYAEAMCSGTITDVTERLAGRVAIDARATSEGTPTRSATKAKLRSAVEHLSGPVRQRGLFELSARECVKRAEHIAMMDLVFDGFIAQTAERRAVAQEIESYGLEWTRLDTKALLFQSEEAAREAALLMREDGLPIAKAAAIAGSKVTDTHHVLEDVGPPLRDRLVSAQPGDLIGPVHVEDGFLVASVTGRVEPSAGDASIRARARNRIERRTVQGEIEKRIKWYERF